MMHQNCLALSLWLLAPLQPYESLHNCLMYLLFSGGEFESPVKLMEDLSNWENLHY